MLFGCGGVGLVEANRLVVSPAALITVTRASTMTTGAAIHLSLTMR